MKFITSPFTLALASVLTLQASSENRGDVFTSLANHGSGDSTDYHGFDILRGWLSPPKSHNNAIDGPSPHPHHIHPLTVEAAFNDTDLFVDYVFNSFDDEDEHQIELELELALTRRLGVIFETAYEFEREDGSTERGFADIAATVRFVLIEFENVVSTASLKFGLPTGDNDFSANELVIEPGLVTWINLGNGFSLNTFVGLEIGTESGEQEFAFDGALVRSFGGALALTLESRNEFALSGEERGDITSEATLGAIYRLNKHTSLRSGWSFPVSNSDLNAGAIVGLEFSF